MNVRPEYLTWWQAQLHAIGDGGYMVMPLKGCILRLHHSKKEAELVCCEKRFQGNETDRINQACLRALGWKQTVAKNLSYDPKEFLRDRPGPDFIDISLLDTMRQIEKDRASLN